MTLRPSVRKTREEHGSVGETAFLLWKWNRETPGIEAYSPTETPCSLVVGPTVLVICPLIIFQV